MKIPFLGKFLPSWKNILLAVLAAGLLILSFPDFEYWFLAWFALVPLMWAIDRQKHCVHACFLLGGLFGTLFFFGTCWWLTYAPINYAGFPPILAYFLLLCVTAITGLFPGIFAAILAVFLRRFGSRAFLVAPFVWVACEFARYWLTGNDWNAIGYSQAFSLRALELASIGGLALVSFAIAVLASIICITFIGKNAWIRDEDFRWAAKGIFLMRLRFWEALEENRMFRFEPRNQRVLFFYVLVPILLMSSGILALYLFAGSSGSARYQGSQTSILIGIQANVPMSGLDSHKWSELRQRQINLAEIEIRKLRSTNNELPITVVLPESPMNFMYSDDREFQKFINDFARDNNVSVLFNSSEPDKATTKYFNSAVMVGRDGRKIDEYDKIYLLPFGEAVPWFLEGIVPGFVGNFAYGREYDLFPVGDARAGVMICFESHFGALSREYVRNGADALIEMTNDGYLGPTPVLRQHLANAVFRAVETSRPVLRVTNVGITAYITEKGEVLDATQPYQEDTRVWSVSKSNGSQTFYVKYGDWFAWLCSIITLGVLGYAVFRRGQ